MSEPQLCLYLLKLENEKYFVYASEYKEDAIIILECTISFQYVKTNKPLLIIDAQDLQDTNDIDYTVKRYMLIYGRDNVRGGNYEYIALPPDFNMLCHATPSTKEEILSYSQYITDLIEAFSKNTNISELETAVNKTIKETQLFMKSKCDYEKFSYYYTNGGMQKFDRSILINIRLLSDLIDNDTNTCPADIQNIYDELLCVFKKITEYYFKINEEDDGPSYILRQPECVFSCLIFPSSARIEKSLTKEIKKLAKHLLCKFEGMAYKVINFLDEAEFDINYCDKYYSRRLIAKMEYLNMLVEGKNN